MAVYFDGTHLASDKGTAELHAVAERAGIPDVCFHLGAKVPHYDVRQQDRKGLEGLPVERASRSRLFTTCMQGLR